MKTASRSRLRPSAEPPARAWQRMLSGRRLDLLDPAALDIEIDDIALGLSRVARWNGQTLGEHGFSVAQHSLVVEDICGHLDPHLPTSWRLAALLHDAPEYVIGDMISPFKTALGFDYKRFETLLEQAVHIRFGLPARLPPTLKTLIKRADRACAYFEATQLAGFSDAEARQYIGEPPKGCHLNLMPLAEHEVRRLFISRFHALSQKEKPAS